MKRLLSLLCTAGAIAACAMAGSFINGNFETGDSSGWTIGGGYRGSVYNPLNPAAFLPGGALYSASIANGHSGIVTPGLDPNTGNQLNRVYSGNYSWRVEDFETVGGYASVISQTVTNYTDPNIFFAWAAVLEGAHGLTDAATVQITLTDLTTSTLLISRQYNAASGGGGVDPRFKYNAATNTYWTPWQIEQLAIDATLAGHDFNLSVLAADCNPTGHFGYLYLDGFGSVAPPPTGDVPEPATFGMIAFGLGALALKFRKR